MQIYEPDPIIEKNTDYAKKLLEMLRQASSRGHVGIVKDLL
jgi:hypothetical protein